MRPYLPSFLGLLLSVLAQTCHAAHWQPLGRPEGANTGLVYIDLDSVHRQDALRVALFLTVYPKASANIHNIRLDRVAQRTAFDCNKKMFALVSTTAYLEGKEVGRSSDKADWKETFKEVPPDPFSQRAYSTTCHSAVAASPEADDAELESAGSVVLPGPDDSNVAPARPPTP
jgi:hypothetical protein